MAKIKYWDAQSQSYKQSQGVSSLNGMVGDVAIPLSNRNLLDNGWFTVNQRGATSVTATIGVDRWQVNTGCTEVVNSNGISLTCTNVGNGIYERIENASLYAGKTFTASANINNTIQSMNFTLPNTITENWSYEQEFTTYKIRIVWLYSENLLQIGIGFLDTSATLNIRAIKLELGNKSTLAYDVAPNYAEELLKCQRYFINGVGKYCSGYISSASIATILIPLPCDMRTTPTIVAHYYDNVVCNGSYKVVTGASIYQKRNSSLIVNVTFTGTYTTLYPCNISNTALDISADL